MKRILVVDDCAAMRDEIANVLRLEGFDVTTVGNGAEALVEINARPPDLVVCDVMMPRLDGFGTLRVLRANARTARIPFVIVTAKTSADDRRHGNELGADAYVEKPLSIVRLVEAVQAQLGAGA
jgi:DNA-binding response OmpR family regulator